MSAPSLRQPYTKGDFVKEEVPALVPAVDRAMQILKAYRTGDDAYGVSDLSRLLNLNKSTVFDILNTLTYHNLLERDDDTKKYRLGPALFHLGNLVVERLSVRDVAHPFVRDLAVQYASTVVLGTFTPSGSVMIMDSAEPELEIKISPSLGSRMSHWAGAFGKIFHAALSPEALRQLLHDKPMRPHTPYTIVDWTIYGQELERVRQNGYATDYEEFLHGLRAVGVPINDREGRVTAALVIMGWVRLMDEAKIEVLTRELPYYGERISELLGAREYPQWNGTFAE